ncbi:hypothetical protein D3C72_1993050 [compost metagenome]
MGHAQHQHVGGEEFGQELLGALQLGLLHGAQAILGTAQHRQQVARQVCRRILVQVAHGDLGVRVGRDQVGHHAGGQVAGNGVVAEDAGIDLQDVHVFLHEGAVAMEERYWLAIGIGSEAKCK